MYTGCFPFSGIVSLLHNDISSFLLNLDVVVCKTLQRLIHLLLLYNYYTTCQVTRRGDRDRYSKIADAFHTPILVKVLRIVGLSLLSLLCLQKIRNR